MTDSFPVSPPFRKKNLDSAGRLYLAIIQTRLFSLEFFNKFVFLKWFDIEMVCIDPGQCVRILYTEHSLPVNKNHSQFISSSVKIPMQLREATNMPCPIRRKYTKKSRKFCSDENLGEGLTGENPNFSGDSTGI